MIQICGSVLGKGVVVLVRRAEVFLGAMNSGGSGREGDGVGAAMIDLLVQERRL